MLIPILHYNEIRDKYIVCLCTHIDFQSNYSSKWMDDPIMGEKSRLAQVDVCESTHEFDHLDDAVEFISGGRHG